MSRFLLSLHSLPLMKEIYNIMFSKETYTERRRRLAEKVGGGLILLLGNDESGRNFEDAPYPYRQDSTFLYYFGLPYAGLNAVIDADSGESILFGDELSIDHIVWMGTQPTLHEKAHNVGVEHMMTSDSLRGVLDAARKAGRTIHTLPEYRAEHTLKLWRLLDLKPGDHKASVDLIRAIVDQRNHKSAEEIEEIERACNVTADMHIETIRCVRPGMYEYEVMAALERVAAANNCTLSFNTICTINGQTLHNPYHGNLIKPGDMVLVDAGAETQMGYAGDMTSTIPADRRFTPRQKAVYDVQVAAHQAAVEMLRPGVPFIDVHNRAAEVVAQGMRDLGMLSCSAQDAVESGAYALFFQTGLGHLMGLDDHDMENLGEVWVGYDGKPKSTQFGRKSLRLARPLEPGMVHTIEPGVYFIPELIDLWKKEGRFADQIVYSEVEKWRDWGGVRNEEDFLITDTGARRLGKKIPLTTDEVEAMR